MGLITVHHTDVVVNPSDGKVRIQLFLASFRSDPSRDLYARAPMSTCCANACLIKKHRSLSGAVDTEVQRHLVDRLSYKQRQECEGH
jgi:hypothetical protein